MGNIVEILENDVTISRYEYDALGRLTREDNTVFGKTTTWAYDSNGNILVKKEYDLTAKPTEELRLLSPLACKLYTYQNNSDQLVSYDGDSFDYDDIGNPDIYRNKEIVWDKGRQMIDYDDGNVEFSYDARGRRTKKNDITFTYDSDGNLIRQSDGVQTLVFLYDHTGVFAVKYDNTTYYYRKDAQGNVIALLDNTGAVVVKYVYDAWGNCKALNANGVEITDTAHIGYLNPFRYRGYCYDSESGLYYLNGRYYDPEIGRFLNPDISIGGNLDYLSNNLYCYCGNDPVDRVDANGCKWWKALLNIVAAVVTVIAGATLVEAIVQVPVVVPVVAVVETAHVINAITSMVHSGKNGSFDTDKKISSQSSISSDMKLGFSTIPDMGCGAIATHNAILLAGGESHFAKVVKYMEAHDLTMGVGGVYFTNIQLYLTRKKKYSNKCYPYFLHLRKADPEDMDHQISNSPHKVGILAYKGYYRDSNEKEHSYGHYIAIKYNANNEFELWNEDKNVQPCVITGSVKNYILNDNKRIPLVLITF